MCLGGGGAAQWLEDRDCSTSLGDLRPEYMVQLHEVAGSLHRALLVGVQRDGRAPVAEAALGGGSRRRGGEGGGRRVFEEAPHGADRLANSRSGPDPPGLFDVEPLAGKGADQHRAPVQPPGRRHVSWLGLARAAGGSGQSHEGVVVRMPEEWFPGYGRWSRCEAGEWFLLLAALLQEPLRDHISAEAAHQLRKLECYVQRLCGIANQCREVRALERARNGGAAAHGECARGLGCQRLRRAVGGGLQKVGRGHRIPAGRLRAMDASARCLRHGQHADPAGGHR
mmetsp:Transcript_111992/g.229286  ORF Transcript_111992/g.229286 Transcript_111992/m.229286 type:complete len:283 (+) Transcript_111992:3-851(+)